MAKPKQILELEKHYGIQLREVKEEAIIMSWGKGINTFLLNKQKHIIGLNINYNKISDYSFLKGLPQLQSLDLRANQISDARFLQGLTQLQSLNLHYNQISDVRFLAALTQLQSLSLSYNQISDARFLQGLTQLQSLNLNSNQISDARFLQGLTKLQSLSLSHNQISDARFLQGLTQLQSLNLNSNQISDARFLQGLTKLQSLSLSHNQISDARFLQGLTQLQSLNLFGNQISDASFLAALTQLQSLDLSHNQISDVRFLQGLTQLQSLSLSFNKISDASFLAALTQLQSLNLDSNEIKDYSFLAALTQLQSLSLSHNQISDASFLAALTQLQSLNLDSNEIKDYSFLGGMTQLQSLNLDSNQISDASFLAALTQLQSLNLDSNEIKDYSFLAALTQLQSLSLKDNQISDYSFLAELMQLQSLSLNDNQISKFTLAFLRKFKKLKSLYLSGNPIQNIPKEIFSKNNCLEPVRNYLEDLEQGKSKNNVLKLIFIGNGNVGKTQIAKRFTEQEKFVFDSQHRSTHAIVRMKRDFGEVELQLWDFAGQDIYHATHRLFMQTRALFVLVWDWENERQPFHTWEGKNYKNEKLLYWLEYAACFGQGSPILVLQNKVDTPEDAQKCLMQQVQHYYQKHYPILGFVQVSAKTGRGFAILEDRLDEKLAKNPTLQAFLNQELPNSWIAVRLAVEALQDKEQKTMEFGDFQALCAKQAVKKSTSTILNYLHDTGLVYYQSRYFGGKIILNQDWAIKAVYQILDRTSTIAEILFDQQGRLKYRNLCQIWSNHSDAEKKLFMDFMLSTELCFETTDKNIEKWWEEKPLEERSFVLPAFLPEQMPLEVDFLVGEYIGELAPSTRGEKYEVVRRYRFLPTVFMQRFIVAANRLSEVDLMWQQGIFLDTTEGAAIVKANYEQKEMVIQANTPVLLRRIEEELDKIANEGKIKAQERKSSNDPKDPLRLHEAYMRGLKGLRPKDKTNILSRTPKQKNRQMYETIKDYIVEGRIDKAFKETLIWVQNMDNRASSLEFDLLRSRYRNNEVRYHDGKLALHDYRVEHNHITEALLKMLEKLRKAEKEEDGSAIGGSNNVVISGVSGSKIQIGGNKPAIPKEKILFLAANPSDASRLQTDLEYRIIKAELERGQSRDSYEFLLPQLSLTIGELIRAMKVKPEIVHFSGHGTTKGIVTVQDNNLHQILPIPALQRLFKRVKGHTKVVLLNACHSAAQAEMISKFGMYVIGNNLPIGDNAAISFAKGFYIGLGDGKTVEEAFDDAMIVLLTENAQYVDVVEIWKDGVQLDL